MSAALAWHEGTRLLVLAPHPDDESLAAGGAIQAALAAGGRVAVVVATDGDDNPWPQRRLERRWRIDAAARARWGARRCDEARAALRLLGVPAGAQSFLHWPDQGLTAALVERGAECIAALAAQLDAFAPTRVIAPVRNDTHPDHSALRLMLDAALCRRGAAAGAIEVLGYRVHGGLSAGARVQPLDARTLQRKREAVLCHRTQQVYGRGRLLRFVAAQESFEIDVLPPPAGTRWHWRLPAGPPWLRAVERHLLLVGCDRRGGWHARRFRAPEALAAAVPGARWRRAGDGVEVDTAPLWPDAGMVHAKLERVGLSWLVFDDGGWVAAAP